MAQDLKVCDLEIACYADLAAKWNNLDAILLEYISILTYISNDAVTSGEVHDTIELLKSEAKNIYGNIKGIGGDVSNIAESFLSKIETIDLHLYDGV